MDELKKIVLEIGAAVIAKRMGESYAQTVNNWLQRETGVPDGKVRLFCEAIEYKKTPHELRSDLYPHPHDGLPEHLRKQQKAA